MLVVSSAFDVCDPALASLLNDRGPFDHGRRDAEEREGPCAEPNVAESHREKEHERTVADAHPIF